MMRKRNNSKTHFSEKLQTISAHPDGVNCVRIGPCSGQVLATGGEDHKVNLWRVGRPSCLLSINAAKTPIRCVSFDPEERYVAAGAESGSLSLFALNAGGKARSRLSGHRAECTSVAFHPLGNVVVSGSADTNVRVWDIRNRNCVRTFMGHTDSITCTEYSPDGRWVASGSKDKTVKIWDLKSGKIVHDFTGHRGGITSVKFHPDEFWLATGSLDGTVKYWDLETFRLVGSTPSERGTAVRQLAFLQRGNNSKVHSLVCTGDDGPRVWGLQPCRCIASESINWGTLGDSHISEDKSGDQQLISCCLNQKSIVSVWSVNMSRLTKPGRVPSPKEEDDDLVEVYHLPRKPESKVSEEKISQLLIESSSDEEDDDYYESDFQDDDEVEEVAASPPAVEQKQSAAVVEKPIIKPTSKAPPKTAHVQLKVPLVVSERAPKTADSVVSKRKPLVPKFVKKKREEKCQNDDDEETRLEASRKVIGSLAKHHDQPLDLSISEFMGVPKQSSNNLVCNPSSSLRAEMKLNLVDTLLKGHRKFQNVMEERAEEILHVTGLWRDGSTIPALEYLETLQNISVTYDFLKSIKLQNGQTATLDVCVAILPLLVSLLSSQFEDYLKIALSSAKFLFDSFSEIVISTLDHYHKQKTRAAVDISREERITKCKRIGQGFKDVFQVLDKLVVSSAINNLARTKRDAKHLHLKLEKFINRVNS